MWINIGILILNMKLNVMILTIILTIFVDIFVAHISSTQGVRDAIFPWLYLSPVLGSYSIE